MEKRLKILLTVMFLVAIFPIQTFAGVNFRAVLKGESASQSQNDSSLIFMQSMLPQLRTAAENLKWSRNLQYISNVAGYLVPLIGYSKETKINDDDYWYTTTEQESKLSTFGYMLSIGSTASSIASVYKAGQAGSDLYKISYNMPGDQGYELAEAGKNLQSFRNLSYISSGLGLISNIYLVNSLNAIDDDEEVGTQQLVTGLTLGLSSFILKVIAVKKVGSAGDKIEKFSNSMTNEWQKYYFTECSKNLKEYNQRWNNGVGLIASGIALALAGALTGDQNFATGGAIGGGLMALIGHVYMAWVAPADLGSAGDNLRDFEERMHRESLISQRK